MKKQEEPLIPLISSLGVLFLFFSAGTLVNIKVGIGLLVFISSFIGFLGNWAPYRLEGIKSLWFDKVLIEVHYLFIFVTIMVSLYFLCFLRGNYKLIEINE